ncbi:hypothetical protein ABPG75_007729 [Micractinium tetrahymenae]
MQVVIQHGCERRRTALLISLTLVSLLLAAVSLLRCTTEARRFTVATCGADCSWQLRARPFGSQRVVTLLQFNRRFAELAQNCVYSLVKFSGVRSYVVATWTPQDLAACAELNLPCADVASLLPRPLANASGNSATDDTDVAWGRKVFSAEESFLALVERSQADGAFVAENPVNTGVFFVLPTAPVLKVFSLMANRASEAMEGRLLEQAEFKKLADWEYVVCGSSAGCNNKRSELRSKRWGLALFRTFPPSSFLETSDICALEHGVRWGEGFHPRIDPCDSTALFVHTICVTGLASKRQALRGARWWYMDADEASGACPAGPAGLPLCQPLRWRLPEAEAAQYACTARPWLGLSRPLAAVEPTRPAGRRMHSAPAPLPAHVN